MKYKIIDKIRNEIDGGVYNKFKIDLGNFFLITSILKFKEPRKFNETANNVKVGVIYSYLNDKNITTEQPNGQYLFYIQDITIVKKPNGEIYFQYPSYKKKDGSEWVKQFKFSKDFETLIEQLYKEI